MDMHATWDGKGFAVTVKEWWSKPRSSRVDCRVVDIPLAKFLLSRMAIKHHAHLFFHNLPAEPCSTPHFDRADVVKAAPTSKPTGLFRFFKHKRNAHKTVQGKVWDDGWTRSGGR